MNNPAEKWHQFLAGSHAVMLIFGLVWGGATISIARLPGQTNSKEKVNLYQSYDKSTNATKVETTLMTIFGFVSNETDPGLDNSGLTMKASFTYPGSTPVSPRSVQLEFRTRNVDYRFRRPLRIEADNEVLEIQELGLGENRFHVLTLTASMNADTFRRIAGAAKVNMKLGNYEFKLKSEQLANLNGLAKQLSH